MGWFCFNIGACRYNHKYYEWARWEIYSKNAKESLKDRKQALIADGMSVEAVEKELFYDAITFGLITKWRVIHLPIAMMFFILAILHIITIIIFS
ncbi:MAG: hypothetical protein IPP49_04750 [Saprospiraceae bacterium]|nr:hypothetical protein [Saprospiraceae bacterium]